MKDSLQFNVQFIEFIREKPCLYDYKRSDYSNRNIQDSAWEEIGKKIQEPVADCKERWKNIRGCYTRYLKHSTPSGSSTKSVKRYYLADHLFFLEPFTKTRPSKGELNAIAKASKNVDLIHQNETCQDSDSDTQEYKCPCPEYVISDEEHNFSKPKLAQIIAKKKKMAYSDVKSTVTEYCKLKQRNIKRNESRDPDLAFLYSILPDMKDMTREQKIKFKVGVLNLAGEVLKDETKIPEIICSPLNSGKFSDSSGQSTTSANPT